MPVNDTFRPYTRPKDQMLGPRWKRVILERLAWIRMLFTSPLLSKGEEEEVSGQRALVQINTRLIGWTVAVVLLGMPLAWLWHGFQVQRNASSLLIRAKQYEEQKAWAEAASMCTQYLQLRPNDAGVRIRLAKAFDQTASTLPLKQKTIRYYSDAVRLATEEPVLRRRLAELYGDVGRWDMAATEAEQLLLLVPNDASGWRMWALSQHQLIKLGANIQLASAVDAYKKAVSLNPGDAKLAATLATIYRTELKNPSPPQREALANEVLDILIQNNPDSAEALLARYSYRVRFHLPDADADLDRALEVAADSINVILAAGERALQRNQFDVAEDFFRRAVQSAPRDRRGYLNLGETQLRKGLVAECLATWRKALEALGDDDIVLNLRLVSVLIHDRRMREAEAVLTRLDRAVVALPTTIDSDARNRLVLDVDFAHARLWVARGEYYRASPQLRRILTSLTAVISTDNVRPLIEAYYELAQCYFGQNQPDLAAGAFEQAAKVQPDVAAHYIAAGEACDLAGQHEAALAHFEQARRLDASSPRLRLRTALAEFNRQRALPEGQRDWRNVELALEEIRRTAPDDENLALLEADVLSTQGKTDEALARLKQSYEKHSDSTRLLESLVLAEARWGEPSQSSALLEKLEQSGKASSSAKLLRVALLARQGKLAEGRALLSQLVDSAPPDEQPAYLLQLAQLDLEEGQVDSARRRFAELYEKQPGSVPIVRQLAELARQAGDRAEVQLWEDRLRTLEGQDGTWWRYLRASRLLDESDSTSDSAFVEAQRLQAEIAAIRPNAPQGFVLKGQMAERRNLPAEAIAAYETAVQLGETSIAPVQRLIALFYKENRLADADRYLTRIEDELSFSGDLASAAVNVSAQYGQIERSVRIAEAGVRRRPNEPSSYLVLGRARLLAGQAAAAEQAFARAVELAPRDAQTWLALLGYYVRVGRPEEARSTLEKMGQTADASPATRAFLFGQCHELMGDLDEADRHYRQAVAGAPDDANIQQRSAMFFARRDPELALTALRQVLRLDPGSELGRRYLVQVLLMAGGKQHLDEAFQVLGASSEQASADDVRLRVAALIRSGGTERRQLAVQILEKLVGEERDVQPEDRLLLARLQEADGRFPRARELYREVVTRPDPKPQHIAAFIEFLLRNDQTQDANPWIAQLDVVAPDDLMTIELRARWLKQLGRSPEIEPMIENFLAPRLDLPENADKRPEAFWRIAQLYARLEHREAAERWFEKAMQLAPERFADLASWYVAQERYSDAVDLCLKVAERDQSSGPAIVLCDVLVAARGPSAEVDRCQKYLNDQLTRHADDNTLALAVANLRAIQDRGSEAIEFYRQVLSREPGNVAAANNLALWLALDASKRAEARRLIDDTLARAGDQPALRDTLGVVQLLSGSVEEALKEFHSLATGSESNSAFYFHLAKAYLVQSETQTASLDEAKWAIGKALEEGLTQAPLLPFEQRWLSEMQKLLVN